jgi:hypothetical protein
LIATELATNSLMYTGGACRLAFWQTVGSTRCRGRADKGQIKTLGEPTEAVPSGLPVALG